MASIAAAAAAASDSGRTGVGRTQGTPTVIWTGARRRRVTPHTHFPRPLHPPSVWGTPHGGNPTPANLVSAPVSARDTDGRPRKGRRDASGTPPVAPGFRARTFRRVGRKDPPGTESEGDTGFRPTRFGQTRTGPQVSHRTPDAHLNPSSGDGRPGKGPPPYPTNRLPTPVPLPLHRGPGLVSRRPVLTLGVSDRLG